MNLNDYRLILVITGVILGWQRLSAARGRAATGPSGAPMLRGGGVFLNGFPRRASFSLQFRLAGERFFGTGFPSPGDKKFILDRAGRRKIECEGFVQDGEGAGCFIRS